MKTTRYILALLLALMAAATEAQNSNVLSIPDVTAQIGTAYLPVNIDNTDEIVAVQMDLVLPDGFTSTNVTQPGNRLTDHEVSVRTMSKLGCYRVLVFSPTNSALLGQSGTLFYLQISVPGSVDEGAEYPIQMINVVLTKASGENVCTGQSAGLIKIAKLPDLTVSTISADRTAIAPGDSLTLRWTVENTGGLDTSGGWTEQLSLVSANGNATKLLATTYHQEPLAAGASVQREEQVLLPWLLGMEGSVRTEVRIVPNSQTGEPASAQGNNTLRSEQVLTLDKALRLELSATAVEEGGNGTVTATLTRSGSTASQQLFTITATSDPRISCPQAVNIAQGQSTARFSIKVSDDDVLAEADTTAITLTASGNGYQSAATQLQVIDNEMKALTLTATPTVLTEGEQLMLTITTNRPAAYPITVTLSCDQPRRFSLPQTAVIPAGETSVEVAVSATDDDLPGQTFTAAFTASAPRHIQAEALVVVNDNDMPVLALELTPATVQESVGPVAVTGVLRRLTNKDNKITVKLSDDADGALYFDTRTLEMEKGTEQVFFNFGPVDNAVVDGDRTYTITASVWLATCSCEADGESAGSVKAQLTVLDNDGPALQLTTGASTVKEGDTTTITVSRNTSTETALTVTLTADQAEGITFPASVTIPAGQTSATVDLVSTKNDTSGDSRTVVLTARAEGYSAGTCYFMLTDQTLPDARIADIALSPASVTAGTPASLSVTIENAGADVLKAPVKVSVYAGGKSIATLYTSRDLAVGETETLSKELESFAEVGVKHIHAIVNEAKKTEELVYTNNTSQTVDLEVTSPFTGITMTTDKTVYQQGEQVTISGQVGHADNQQVEVYLVNSEVRQTITAVTDSEGRFTATFTPAAAQCGHFTAGACYPGEELIEEVCAFDIYGFRRLTKDYIKCETLVEKPYEGEIVIENNGQLPLTGITAEVMANPADCTIELEGIDRLEAGQQASIRYTLTGHSASTGNEWEHIGIRLAAAEGFEHNVTLYYFCRTEKGHIEASVQRINTTMNLDGPRQYPFTIKNTGSGETGAISVVLPDWMTSATPTVMASLKQGEEATVVLSLNPNDQMEYGLAITGYFSLNCANGNSISIPYTVTPVSEKTGTLVVDVCDEYTYYTEEAPHVSGARVKVLQMGTSIVLAEGTTGSDGCYRVELPEGNYDITVSAEKHDSYSGAVLVNPGTAATWKTVNLSYQAVTVDFSVEEITIEDSYKIETTVVYETNVPRPVVEVIFPDSLPLVNHIFSIVATNKGLITAQNVRIEFPKIEGAHFELLNADGDGISILPQQSQVYNCRLTMDGQTAGSRQIGPRKGAVGCLAGMIALYYVWYCGLEEKLGKNFANYTYGECTNSIFYDILQMLGNLGGGGPGSPGGGGPGGGGSGGYYTGKTIERSCEGCYNMFRDKIIGCIPIVGCAWSLAHAKSILGGGVTAVGCVVDEIGNMTCLTGLVDPCERVISFDSRRRASTQPSYITAFQEKFKVAVDEMQAIKTIIDDRFNNDAWYDCDRQEFEQFYAKFLSMNPEENLLQPEDLMDVRPANISVDMLTRFVERSNNTLKRINGLDYDATNVIDVDLFNAQQEKIDSCEQAARDYGYDSVQHLVDEQKADIVEKMESEKRSSVCSSVTLRFSQTMTMTRQAFRGTLSMTNGNTDGALTDVQLKLEVKSKDGLVATAHEMQINHESLTGFSGEMGFDSGWTLQTDETGVATIVFIPTKYAAPTEPVEYSFGGEVSYIDPTTETRVTMELSPVTMTVKPCPELDLTYFMQRDVYGDDPLTLDVVEPMVPAEFALIINNKGYGDATNVHMTTEQPEIIENEKGLLIDFELISSQVNGGEANLSFGQAIANDFGTIPAHSQMYAQWWLQASLLGHFTSYKVEATHLTSYGNPDLTLLDQVTIHELIHSLELPTARGFLVNDIQDANDLPDMLYLTNGEVLPVSTAIEATAERQTTDVTTEASYLITIQPSAEGWNYGSLLDPTHGLASIRSIVRQSDGQEIATRNFWQTDRTLRDGKDWLYENRLHFADEFADDTPQTYVLTVDPLPDVLLAVDSITGIPAEGTIAFDPVNEVTVCLNKPVDATTFTTDDLNFVVQGTKQDASLIGISTDDNQTFTLDLSAATEQAPNGYYTLTVQTADITDQEGFQGRNGLSKGWIMYRGGLVQLLTSAWPEQAGSVSRKTDAARALAPRRSDMSDDTAQYGSTVTLVAEPAEGYELVNWTLDGEVVSTDLEYEVLAISDMNVVANFALKTYRVEIAATDAAQGRIDGTATGIYEHGTQLQLQAVPTDDYAFAGWTADGQPIGDETPQLSVTVDKAMTIAAEFQREFFYQTVTLANGWNWVSSWMTDAFSTDVLVTYANRVLSQTDELYRDPVYGMVGSLSTMQAGQAYKVQTGREATYTLRGHRYADDAALSLSKGWNWMAYPVMEEAGLDAVIKNAQEGDYITSLSGFAEYAEGSWKGSLTTLVPGEGYLYKSAQDKALTFSATPAPARAASPTAAATGVWQTRQYPSTMSVTAHIVSDGMELTGADYVIRAVADDGLRGESQWVGSRHYLTVYGDTPVAIRLEVEHRPTGQVFVTDACLQFRADVVGSRLQPYPVSIGTPTGITDLTTGATPRPTVYDLQGRKATDGQLRKGIYINDRRKVVVK